MGDITKYEVYKFMCDTYKRTRFPFFNKVDLMRHGATDKILWALHKEGKVRRRKGIQGRIVELIIDGEGNDS